MLLLDLTAYVWLPTVFILPVQPQWFEVRTYRSKKLAMAMKTLMVSGDEDSKPFACLLVHGDTHFLHSLVCTEGDSTTPGFPVHENYKATKAFWKSPQGPIIAKHLTRTRTRGGPVPLVHIAEHAYSVVAQCVCTTPCNCLVGPVFLNPRDLPEQIVSYLHYTSAELGFVLHPRFVAFNLFERGPAVLRDLAMYTKTRVMHNVPKLYGCSFLLIHVLAGKILVEVTGRSTCVAKKYESVLIPASHWFTVKRLGYATTLSFGV